MTDDNPEIAFPSIKFPIVTDLQVNAFELSRQYDAPPPGNLYDIATIVLTNVIVNMFCNERINHKPAPGADEDLDIKGACFLYIIGTAMCRVLLEQGNDIDLAEIYRGSGDAIFQGCPEDYVSSVLEEGQQLAERFFEEALTNDDINEFVLFVMSMGLLYSIEPKDDAMSGIVSLFGQIKEF